MNMKKEYNHIETTIKDCLVIELSKINESSGKIVILENSETIPFDIQRVYYLYDIPDSGKRGGHAHYNLEQYLIAINGSFKVKLFDGNKDKIVSLNNPNQALHIVPGIWRELINFSADAICLVMASLKYDEKDYIRDVDLFVNSKNN